MIYPFNGLQVNVTNTQMRKSQLLLTSLALFEAHARLLSA